MDPSKISRKIISLKILAIKIKRKALKEVKRNLSTSTLDICCTIGAL